MARKLRMFPRPTRGLSNAKLVAQEPWIVDLDAVELADAIAEAVEDEAEKAIRSGEHGTVRGRPRGLNTGLLASSFTHRTPSGSSGGFKARTKVRSGARSRRAFLEAEADRGVDYLSDERAAKTIDRAVLEWLAKALG